MIMDCVARSGLALSLLLAGALSAAAQDYPHQAVKLVVPFVAGGGVDVVARIIAPRLAEELGQPVIIENRGGAGGALGAAAVAQSPPDGYTILFGTGSTHGTNPAVYPKLPYDPVRDFTPIVLCTTSPLLLIAPPSLPAKTASDLIALARAKPGEFSFASYGTGSINHLGAVLFNSMAKIEANHIPYRGSAPALTDLIGGRVQYTFDGVSTSMGYIQAGTIKALAASGLKRTPVFPDLPTIAETALPGFDTTVWFGLFAPAATPKAVVDLINRKTNAVLANPRVQENFIQLGIEAAGGGPDILAGKVKTEIEKWATIVREQNIRVDQ
jgi:tripartite-type tricarboxylate transporter receptor subunit TctC